MIKTFKKSIALFVALVFVMSLVPFGVMADTTQETAQIYFTNYSYTRKSGYSYLDNPGLVDTHNATTYEIHFGGQYYAYAQLDLTGYEEILANDGTSIKASVYGGPSYRTETSSVTRKCGNFNAYLVNDKADASYVAKVTTQRQADGLGMHDTNRPILFARSDASTITSKQFDVDANLENLVASLNEGSDNSLVTLYFAPFGASGDPGYLSTSYIGPKVSYLEISYDKTKIDNQDYVNTITKDITWEDLSDEDESNVTKLPTFYKGADISWEASVPGIVAQDGTITPPLGVAADVTLTASFSYKGAYADAQTGTATATFDVTIAPEQMVTTKAIEFTNYGVARSDNEDCQGFTTNSSDSNIHYTYFGGIFAAYAQFDLSNYEEILRTPSAQVAFKVMGGNGFSKKLYDFKVYLVPDSADGYKYNEINYAGAEELGMFNDDLPVLCERIESDGLDDKTITLTANKENLLQCLNQSAGNGLVTISYAVGESGQQSSVRPNAADTGLYISYYESELNSENYLNSIESSFKWENITNDDANAVVNNLPTYFKGADIVWSSAEGYVTSSGELAIPSDSAIVEDTITANVSYNGNTFTKEFAVTLCDGSLTLGTPALTVDGGVATGSIEITNATGADVTYQLYIAVYADDELTGLVPFTFNVAKGTADVKELTAQNIAEGSKVKFLVWNANGITPATVFAEK